MTINQMQILQSVCEEGSITRAAAKLFMAQPAVSNAIKEIERSFDHPLFIRKQRKLVLTAFGQETLNYVNKILNLYNAMMKNEDPAKTKTIGIGTGTFLGKVYFPGVIRKFREKYPDISIHMYIDTQNNVNRQLMDDEIDFSIMEYLTIDRGVLHFPLVNTDVIGICNSSHPFAKRRDVDPEEVIRYPLLMREQNSSTSIAVSDFFINRNIMIQPNWRSISITSIINAVKENLGISFISHLNYATYQCSELSTFSVRGFESPSYINLYFKKDKTLSDEMIEFITDFRQALIDAEESISGGERLQGSLVPFLPFSPNGK